MNNFVHRIEEKLGVDMEYWIRNGVYSLAGQLVAIVAGLVLSVGFANFLPREVLGQYQYLIAILGVLTAITLPGMNTALMRGSARNNNGVYFAGVNKLLKFSVVITLGIFLYSGYIIFRGDKTLGLTVFVLGLFFPFFSVANSWRAYYAGKENFKIINIIGSLTLVAQVLVQSLLIIWLPKYQYLFLAYVLTTLVVNLPISLKIYRRTQNEPVDTGDIQYGQKLSVALTLGILSGFVDKLILGHSLGVEKLAIYSIAALIPDQAKQLYSNVLLVQYPKFFNLTNQNLARKKLLKLLMILTGITVGLVVLYIGISPTIFRIVFKKYMESLLFSQIIMISAIFTPLVLLEAFLRSERNTRDVFTYNILSSVSMVGGSLLLIPFFGIWGVVGAKFFSLIFSNGFLLLRFRISSLGPAPKTD